MPPRDPELPEGTDAIVSGASRESGTGSGFVAAGGNDTGDGSAMRATDKLVTQVRDQVSTLRDQAGGKLRDYADDGKGKATGLLEDIAAVIEDAARSIDQRLGQEYGDYAHRASGTVSSFAGKVREKSVDELLDDTRSVVRKSPAVAIAAAAVVGFALMRVVRTGLEDVGAKGREKGRGKGNKKSGA